MIVFGQYAQRTIVAKGISPYLIRLFLESGKLILLQTTNPIEGKHLDYFITSLFETDLFRIIVGYFLLFVSFKLRAHLHSLIAYFSHWKIMSMNFLLQIETLFWVLYSFSLLIINLIHCKLIILTVGKRSY